MQPDLFIRDDLKELMQDASPWCVSMYMPAHRVTQKTEEDHIRLKNLMKEAERKLNEVGVPPRELSTEPIERMLEDRSFWQHQSDGLAVFFSQSLFRAYRLPLAFDELVTVTDRFHVKPVLPLLTGDGRFYIPALSQNDIRLFQCTRYSIGEIPLKDMPTSLEEALKYEHQEKQLQFHTGAPGGAGGRPAQYHGQGVGTDDERDRILRFCRVIDKGLQELLPDEQAPMVIAATETLVPIFKEASSYPRITARFVPGNPEHTPPEELHAKAWEIVEPLFQQELQERISTYHEVAGTGQGSADLSEVVKASHHGRTDVLFVALGVQEWGTFNPDLNEVTQSGQETAGAQDLLDFAAVRTLLNSGTVYALGPEDVPSGTSVCAIFRY